MRGFDTRNSKANFLKNYFTTVAVNEVIAQSKVASTYKTYGAALAVAALAAVKTRRSLKVTSTPAGFVLAKAVGGDKACQTVDIVNIDGSIQSEGCIIEILSTESMKEVIEECQENNDTESLENLRRAGLKFKGGK
jgi:hypothetical protein